VGNAVPTFWGDLHAHCAVSYGFGTAERALANGEGHLDFCSVTGHAFWPDMPTDLERNDATMLKHLGGFAKLQRFWPALLAAADAATAAGRIVTLPSYEWHSMRYGDHNVYAAAPELALLDADTPAGLEAAQRAAGADPLVLPHHIGYAAGWRGIDWGTFDARRSPVLEVFSSHGASEADDAPFPYGENMGFRHGPSTARAGLMAGHRFGFQAGTDSHDGYPGHYGHGRVGVVADRLGRAELVDALRARRTIASTGPNVEVEFELDGAGIGQAVRRRDAMRLHLALRATDTVARLELIEGDADGWRVRPLPTVPASSRFEPGRHRVRVETGWGRHGTIASWNVEARVRGGRLIGATPYFRYAGHGNDEPEPTERMLETSEEHAAWRCRSRAVPSGGLGGTHHAAGGPQTVLLDLDGDADTVLTVRSEAGTIAATLPQLTTASQGRFVGGLATPAIVVQRAAPEREWSLVHDLEVRPPSGDHAFVYLRALQADGQAVWVSPVFLD
jgi:hypothetical protein